MSIDPLSDPNVSPALFFTRWITHFCAPVFVCLAGVSAGLMVARKSPAELFRFLLTRGLWLIFVEVFVISTATTFAPGGIEQLGGKTLVFLQVIWAIGSSMVLLSVAAVSSAGECASRSALDRARAQPARRALAGRREPARYQSAAVGRRCMCPCRSVAGPFHFLFLYPLLPWLGVMLLGFGASALFERAPAARRPRADRLGPRDHRAVRRVALRSTSTATRIHWEAHERGLATFFDFLNTTKYPPSLLFLAMTLGPAAIFCAFADRWRGWLKDTFVMFGRVPFAFYVAHFYLLHLMSVLLGVLQGLPVGAAVDLPAVLSEGLRRVAGRGVRRVGGGDRAAVSAVPLDGGREGAQPGLVAQSILGVSVSTIDRLALSAGELRSTSVSTAPTSRMPASMHIGPTNDPGGVLEIARPRAGRWRRRPRPWR